MTLIMSPILLWPNTTLLRCILSFGTARGIWNKKDLVVSTFGLVSQSSPRDIGHYLKKNSIITTFFPLFFYNFIITFVNLNIVFEHTTYFIHSAICFTSVILMILCLFISNFLHMHPSPSVLTEKSVLRRVKIWNQFIHSCHCIYSLQNSARIIVICVQLVKFLQCSFYWLIFNYV